MRNWFLVSKIWSYIFLALIFIYLIFIFSRTAWKNFVFNNKIYKLQKEIEVLEEENLRLKNLVVYYRSGAYQERVARALLNYKAPGEFVIAFPYKAPEREEFKFEEEPKDTRPNYKKWFEFIFKNKS